jgi:hypothetical protein
VYAPGLKTIDDAHEILRSWHRVHVMEEPPLGETSSRAYGTRIMTSVERLVVTLKLRKGTQERAVYLGDELVIFAFEGEDVEGRVRVVINDPVRSASFAAWVPLLAGRPALAHEVYYWEADD